MNFFTCCHTPEVENSAWRIAQTFFRVSEEGWDKGSLCFELVVGEVIITVFGQDRAASDCLVVVRCVLRFSRNGVIISESGVVIRFIGE